MGRNLHLPFRPHRRRTQAGVASLMVVMALFFVISLVAAYASRNLIFEQRTSANQYRSTQAFEAAEAGIEWAAALLNSGRVDASCRPTADAGWDSFRQRYIVSDPVTGAFAQRRTAAGAPLFAGCLRSGAAWACACPGDGTVPIIEVEPAAGLTPAFRVRFESGAAPGQLRIVSIGCTSGDNACLGTGRGNAGDASAVVIAQYALAPAMPTSPAAPLTVRRSLDLGAFALRVANTDPATNGITINAGGTVSAPNADLDSVPGTPGGQSVVDSDASLADMTADRMFLTHFGVERETFKQQPTTLTLDCGTSCGAALRDTVLRNPGRPIWVEGDLTIDEDLAIGSAASPALLVVGGNLTMNASGARIFGIVYTQADHWASSGIGLVQGAVLAEGRVSGTSAPSIVFDPAIVQQVRLTYGSVVRVPGGWRDF